MGTRLLRATRLALFLAVLSSVRPAAAQVPLGISAADDEARREHEAGRDAYDRGQFSQAIEHFGRAYQLSGRPQMLFNVARAADLDGQYARAIEAYEGYLDRLPDAQNREFVQARLQKLRDPSLTPPAPARVVAAPKTAPSSAPVAPPTASLQAWESVQLRAAAPTLRSLYPFVAAQRPLTAPAGLLSLEGWSSAERDCARACPGVRGLLGVGALYGISDDFEVGAIPLRLELAPKASVDSSVLFATYRFLRGAVDFGARANVWLPLKDDFELDLGLSLVWKASPHVALQTGPRLAIVASAQTLTIMEIPVGVVLNATDALWFKPQVGLSLTLSEPGPADTAAMLLGLSAGYTIASASGAPSVEPYVEVSFPWLVNAFDTSTPSTGFWRLYFGVSVFLDTRS
jgi:tetratricopeptide (TPR) repeat protein